MMPAARGVEHLELVPPRTPAARGEPVGQGLRERTHPTDIGCGPPIALWRRRSTRWARDQLRRRFAFDRQPCALALGTVLERQPRRVRLSPHAQSFGIFTERVLVID